MKSMLVAISLLAATGCTQYYDPTDTVSLHLASGFSAELLEAIQEGASWWSCVGANVTIEGEGRPLDVRLVGVASEIGSAAQYDQYAGDIRFDEAKMVNFTPATRASLVAHELGHAFRLMHGNNPDDVMYPRVDDHSRLEAGDVAQFNAVYGTSFEPCKK